MAQKYFEDIQEGYSVTTKSRKITQQMINAFARVTGDFNPIHIDKGRVSNSLFGRTIAKGKRIAHGELTSAIAIGLLNDHDLLEGMGLKSVEKTYTNPVWAGDSVYTVFRVAKKEMLEKMKRFGLLICDMKVFNQDDEMVVYMQIKIFAELRSPVQT
jgi:acyl dehydratase